MDTTLFNWIILPLLIFLARITDVSIGTLRILYVSRGKRILSAALGFFEVLIWLLAIRQIFNNMTNFLCYLTYAGGFAAGNYVGMWIEQKLAVGIQVVRIITRKDAHQLINKLKSDGYGITVVNGEGLDGKVKIIFTIIQRKDLSAVINMVKHFNPRAFFSVEDVRMAAAGIFPNNTIKYSKKFLNHIKMEKKSK